jgi:hypothetical protein
MRAYCFAAALVLGSAAAALADQGVVVAIQPGCDFFAAESPNGIAVLEWYGGIRPDMDQKITGDFDQYGFHDINVVPPGSRMHVWVEDYSLSKDAAAEKLQDKCP